MKEDFHAILSTFGYYRLQQHLRSSFNLEYDGNPVIIILDQSYDPVSAEYHVTIGRHPVFSSDFWNSMVERSIKITKEYGQIVA